jgi:hypothetical protein
MSAWVHGTTGKYKKFVTNEYYSILRKFCDFCIFKVFLGRANRDVTRYAHVNGKTNQLTLLIIRSFKNNDLKPL